MARFSHLPIYQKSFALLVSIEDTVLRMERRARYTIGADLRNIMRSFVVCIARVNTLEVSARTDTFVHMMDLIHQIYILLSVMKELHMFVRKNDYEQMIEAVYEIEKQLE